MTTQDIDDGAITASERIKSWTLTFDEYAEGARALSELFLSVGKSMGEFAESWSRIRSTKE